jgi:hypothetical protein
MRAIDLFRNNNAPHPEARPAPVTGSQSRPGLGLLWGLAVLLFGAGDLFTTAWALGLGATEANPLAAYLMELSGGSIWPLAALKGVILSGLWLVSYFKMGRYAWIIPAVVSAAAALLLIPNIVVLAALV